MKKIDLGQTINTLANLGVIAGIIFLAVELRQNQQLTAAQTRNSIAQVSVNLIRGEAENPQLLEVIAKGMAGEELTPVEQQQFDLSWASYFPHWQNMHYQYERDLFDEEEYAGLLRARARLLANPAIRAVWCSHLPEASPSFVAAMNERLGDTCPESSN